MLQEIKLGDDGNRYLYLQVPQNIKYAFVSSSGKSLVYRVVGEYLKANGEVIGKDGVMSNYISHRIYREFIEVAHRHYHEKDVFKHEFSPGGVRLSAIRICIHPQYGR